MAEGLSLETRCSSLELENFIIEGQLSSSERQCFTFKVQYSRSKLEKLRLGTECSKLYLFFSAFEPQGFYLRLENLISRVLDEPTLQYAITAEGGMAQVSPIKYLLCLNPGLYE